ncbi:hypothetical protein BP6252_02529 [Coleophoma cylindrospora]|uniref:NB-ARC domain-containing protein n=1 Tax=Coleophoma cylindrospora TaxID=1849047 RepID=A0A3D8SF33_9HELO|nr:hypothetical protein BP6252_02529 [Coleophoma cylindrospora]
MPGGGKTHLARQYVYEHKNDFPGGIFWIRAKAMPELAAGYWDIARKAALRGSTEDLSKNDPEQFIRLVRKWLNQRQNWLLVLDGVHFDNPEVIQKYIPDSPNTSLIYTSTQKAVSNDYQFMNPQVIKLPLLSAREAQTLLLLELDKKDPTKDDLLHSMELVQAMGFLPVVIHSVAQRLKATDEPLAKFARHYATEPRLRGLGAYIAVVEQLQMLGATEALNLLRILCFFSQHIPVEMIVLGLKALDVPVKASEPISGRSLNNTFKILNSFALIDRSEPEPSLHSSQSSKGSRDMIADHVDVIRLHSVVQSFFIDTLLADGCLPLWLDRAVRLFCCSFDAANDRIARKTSYGLVEDFRLYEIHGNKLREHARRHLKRYELLGEALSMLDKRLEIVKGEIERRTPESSHVIADGRPDAFQTSIFDRASSSSDADPETPGTVEFHIGMSPWGIEVDKMQLDSPVSIKSVPYDTGFQQSSPYTRQRFPPLRVRDDGYDTDMDESIAMTAKPSQRTIKQNESPTSSEGAWETVSNRRSRLKPAKLNLHRTIKAIENQRYSDTTGAFRVISASAVDPRVTRETAQGFLQRNNTRARTQSRGRISGQSQAEVALTHITKSSPPPARGGGMIQDRRSRSRRPSQERRLVAGAASYAAAVAGPTRDNVPSFRAPQPVSDTLYNSSDTANSDLPPLTSSAMASLKRMSFDSSRLPPSSTNPSSPRQPHTPMPPYPRSPSPSFANQQQYPFSESANYDLMGKSTYSQENLMLGPDPYPAKENIYPRMTGPLPYETLSSSSRELNIPRGYPQWNSRSYETGAASFPAPTYTSPGDRAGFSLSSTDLVMPTLDPYASTRYSGYTSQPMSRDTSVQSNTAIPVQAQRRPSLAATEPLPQLPRFSPRLNANTYQNYDGIRSQEYVPHRYPSTNQGPARKSPRLDFARAALISRLEELPEDLHPFPTRTQRLFNPQAPSFSPRSSYGPYDSPPQPSAPYPTPEMNQSEGGEDMSRSGSGGLRVGNRVIEFGDFPDAIDLALARERVRETWAARENQSSQGVLGLGIRK